MSTTADRILELIDDGLQSSPEHGYGHDARELCARCQRQEPAEGEFCAGCRSFLLEDSDEDPAEWVDVTERVVAYWPMEDPGDDPALQVVNVEMLNRIAQQASETMAAFMDRLPEARIPQEYIERPEDDTHTRWRRRAEYARFLRRPLRATSEQHDEIQRLEPYAGIPVYDLQRIALFGVPLIVEPRERDDTREQFERHYLNRWADADRIQFRAEFMAERAIAGRDGIYDLGTS